MNERRRKEERLRAALDEVEAPEEHRAEERSRRVVEAAFAEQRAAARPRRNTALRAGLALAGSGLVAAFALTPAGAEVSGWIADQMQLGSDDAEPRLTSLPASGSLLVESEAGVWTVTDDGSRRLLGDYERATWSPSGLYAGVTDGPEIRAVAASGETRWVRPPASAEISALGWSTDDGDRIAYLVEGTELHVMAADNSRDSVLDPTVSRVTPAWRPDNSETEIVRQLAYADADGTVRVVDTETGREIFNQVTPAGLRELEWDPRGDALLLVGRKSIELRSGSGTATSWAARGPGNRAARWTEASPAPRGDRIAAVSRSRGKSTVAILSQGGPEELITVPSRISSVDFSPDGEWILLGLPDADQWLFVRARDGEVKAVSNISSQFESPGEAPRVAGWCC